MVSRISIINKIRKHLILALLVVASLVMAAISTAVTFNGGQVHAQVNFCSESAPAPTFCQNLWGTGTTGSVDAQTKRPVNNCWPSNNNSVDCENDPHWQLTRVYSDHVGWGQATTCQNISLYPVSGGSGLPHNGILVDEAPGGAGRYAVNYFGGTGPVYPWGTSANSRWISQNYFGWHDGFGVGKPNWSASPPTRPPSSVMCHDPSSMIHENQGAVWASDTYVSAPGVFGDFSTFHTYVFRLNQSFNIPNTVDLNSLKLVLNGIADNAIAIKVNGQPMNVNCYSGSGNTGLNTYWNLGTSSNQNTLWGEGDGGVKNLPYCTPSDNFTTVGGIEATRVSGSPFVYGSGNIIEVHIKSADTNVGMLLDKVRLEGNLIPMVPIQGRVFDAFTGTVAGVTGVTVNYSIAGVPGTILTGANGNYTFSVPQGSTFTLDVTLPAGVFSRQTQASPAGSYRNCSTAPNTAPGGYCIHQNYISQVAGQNVANGFDRSQDNGYDFALVRRPTLSCNIGSGSLGIVIVGVPRPMPSSTVSIVATSGSPTSGVNGALSVVGVAPTAFTPSPANGSYNNATTALGAGVAYSNSPYTFTSAGAATVRGTPSGTYGSGNWWALTATASTCDASGTVGVGPYMKAYGGDVWAGGGFSPNCASAAGEITAFASAAAPFSGASAQFGVSALLSINQFYSASQRDPGTTTNTVAPKGLSFANTAGTYGGDLGGGGRCITNYWDNTRITSPAPASFVPSVVFPAGVGQRQYYNSSSLTIDTAGIDITVPLGSQIAIFVDGDVQINDNIRYQAGATYLPGTPEELSQMPLLIIVARGNIRIDNNVTQLDAVLIAQPCATTTGGPCNSRQFTGSATPTPGGTIYTCTRQTGELNDTATLYSECNIPAAPNPGGQLVINGALIANRVKFQRAFGRYDTALTREGPADFNTGVVITAGNGPGEVINYTPEVYLAPSPLKNPSTPSDNPGVKPYNAAAGLPPIF